MKTKKEVERFPLHDDPEENIERVQLYEQMAGSVIHGTSTQRPPNFLQKSMKKEIRTFRDAIIKGFIPASKKFLFDGSAAFSSIASAEAAMKSSQTNAVQRIGMR